MLVEVYELGEGATPVLIFIINGCSQAVVSVTAHSRLKQAAITMPSIASIGSIVIKVVKLVNTLLFVLFYLFDSQLSFIDT